MHEGLAVNKGREHTTDPTFRTFPIGLMNFDFPALTHPLSPWPEGIEKAGSRPLHRRRRAQRLPLPRREAVRGPKIPQARVFAPS